MNRDEFLFLLDRAVADGLISDADAAELLRRFDAGTLDLEALPLLPSETVQGVDGEMLAAGLVALLVLLGSADRRAPESVLTGLSTRQRYALVDAVQERFERRAARLGRRLARNELAVDAWQREFGELVRRNLAEQAMAGSGRTTLTRAQLDRIDRLAREQMAYLSRFADTVTVQRAQGAPLTEGQITVRAESYAGYGRGEFFRSLEEAKAEPGIVYDYISRDDDSTCSPCLDAQMSGPYLPGQGPMPGEVCLGRSRCRCRREPRATPDVAAELS